MDVNTSHWRNFFKDINPRKPAPGPEYGIVYKGARACGDRAWWERLISAWHGGARSFKAQQWQRGEWLEYDGEQVWVEEGFCHSISSTSLVPRYRPPSRWKTRNIDHVRVICGADAFVMPSPKASSAG